MLECSSALFPEKSSVCRMVGNKETHSRIFCSIWSLNINYDTYKNRILVRTRGKISLLRYYDDLCLVKTNKQSITSKFNKLTEASQEVRFSVNKGKGICLVGRGRIYAIGKHTLRFRM